MLAPSASDAAAPWGVGSSPAAMPLTLATISSYQPSTAARSAWSRPKACMTAAAASGPARSRRRSACPRGSIASISSSAAPATTSLNRSWTGFSRNGRANGARWRPCSAPSRESIIGPITRAVEKRGSSTVSESSSRIACSARSRRVTSQAPSAGIQATGSVARSRANSAWGSRARSSRVASAPKVVTQPKLGDGRGQEAEAAAAPRTRSSSRGGSSPAKAMIAPPTQNAAAIPTPSASTPARSGPTS